MYSVKRNNLFTANVIFGKDITTRMSHLKKFNLPCYVVLYQTKHMLGTKGLCMNSEDKSSLSDYKQNRSGHVPIHRLDISNMGNVFYDVFFT
jgi:hypothetical protein